MIFNQPVTALIRQRTSRRTYQDRPLEAEIRQRLLDFIAALPPGPFGSSSRLELVSATAQERGALRGLGTYGFIRGAPAFLIGAVPLARLPSGGLREDAKNARLEGGGVLEDFGWQMEALILFATGLDLGTCWLGGSFTRSSFSQKISLREDEMIPAVCALGYPAGQPSGMEVVVRRGAQARSRLEWQSLFFAGSFGTPLSRELAGSYAECLEMVCLAPSASNKQPWRVVWDGEGWHFYRQRTPGYRENLLVRLLGVADMQRLDLGIAMCHFELAARQVGLEGSWQTRQPPIAKLDSLTEYVASWIEG